MTTNAEDRAHRLDRLAAQWDAEAAGSGDPAYCYRMATAQREAAQAARAGTSEGLLTRRARELAELGS